MPRNAEIRKFYLFALLLFSLAALPGCKAKPQTAPADPVLARSAPAASPRYEQGLAAFSAGDYRGAAGLFEPLSSAPGDPLLAQKSAYALACSLFAAAETRDDFKKAVAAFKAWAAMAPLAEAGEDPRLLVPGLKNLKPLGDPRDCPKPAKNDVDCAKRLAEKEREVKVLSHQIKALEKIHREIQERKKELSSP